jgi:alpha-ketoglutarate-dependent taurine dioxygenase
VVLMHVEPLDGTFGATVTEIDLEALDPVVWAELHAAWLEHALLIFPGQFLERDAQNTFARRFGRLEFEAAAISNLDRDGQIRTDPDDDVLKVLRGNEGWHHDSTYMPIQAKGAVFSAEIVPSGGAPTGWADMRAAYDDLDEASRELIADKLAYHSLYYSQGRAGYLPSKRNESGGYDQYGYHDLEPSLRPLVKNHPDTGRHRRDGPRRLRGSPRPPQRLGLPATPRALPPVERRRRRRVGQPPPDAPGNPVRHDPATQDVAHPHRRRA